MTKAQQELLDAIGRVLHGYGEVCFAYVHGSFLRQPDFHDIDVAVFLSPEFLSRHCAGASIHLDYLLPLEDRLGSVTPAPVDAQLLNAAPLPVRYRVVTDGVVVVDRDPAARESFELLSRKEYFDFRPLRERYLREAFG